MIFAFIIVYLSLASLGCRIFAFLYIIKYPIGSLTIQFYTVSIEFLLLITCFLLWFKTKNNFFAKTIKYYFALQLITLILFPIIKYTNWYKNYTIKHAKIIQVEKIAKSINKENNNKNSQKKVKLLIDSLIKSQENDDFSGHNRIEIIKALIKLNADTYILSLSENIEFLNKYFYLFFNDYTSMTPNNLTFEKIVDKHLNIKNTNSKKNIYPAQMHSHAFEIISNRLNNDKYKINLKKYIPLCIDKIKKSDNIYCGRILFQVSNMVKLDRNKIYPYWYNLSIREIGDNRIEMDYSSNLSTEEFLLSHYYFWENWWNINQNKITEIYQKAALKPLASKKDNKNFIMYRPPWKKLEIISKKIKKSAKKNGGYNHGFSETFYFDLKDGTQIKILLEDTFSMKEKNKYYFRKYKNEIVKKLKKYFITQSKNKIITSDFYDFKFHLFDYYKKCLSELNISLNLFDLQIKSIEFIEK